jgi:hypothetical protein
MILKTIANKILKNEIDELKQKLKKQEDEYYEVLKERADDQAKTAKDLADLKSCHETIKQLTSENEILKKYYHLDSEPTDEEKIKIRIDLKIHDLEMQLLQERLRALEYNPPRYLISTNPWMPGPYTWR